MDSNMKGIMKALLDTNIIIHREGSSLNNENIGILYFWLDKLHYDKYVHYHTKNEINKYKDKDARDSLNKKLQSYFAIDIDSPLDPKVVELSQKLDKNENDYVDSSLLNELILNHVDIFITEDRGIKRKAKELGIASRVLNIFEFLEKTISENPSLAEYKIQNVRLEKFGSININQPFFNTLKSNYPNFESWFQSKFNEEAYVSGENDDIKAFLYLKTEGEEECYYDIIPHFQPKKRLKIGTFKVIANGYRLGERFIKIICDNAIKQNVEEIYVTIFEDEEPQKVLVDLLKKFGFQYWGTKGQCERKESVFVKSLVMDYDSTNILSNYPYIPRNKQAYFVAIDPTYHTKLFPDSILNNENPEDFSEHAGFTNAIRKCYITNSYSQMPNKGDILVFYRNGGMHKGVFTTLGIFESYTKFDNFDSFYEYASNRTVLSKQEMLGMWNKNSYYKPKIVDFIYAYSFPKRLNLSYMIGLGFDKEIMGKGIQPISEKVFEKLLEYSNADMRYFSN